MTSINDIQESISAIQDRLGHAHFICKKNDDDNYCCYMCNATIETMDYKTMAIGRYEWERGIEYLVCGVGCPMVPESHKARCVDCDKVVDLGYLPREVKCDRCTNAVYTCCYYCGDHIEDIEEAEIIIDDKDNIKNLVCSFNCRDIPDNMKDNCAYCGTLFCGNSDVCSECWHVAHNSHNDW